MPKTVYTLRMSPRTPGRVSSVASNDRGQIVDGDGDVVGGGVGSLRFGAFPAPGQSAGVPRIAADVGQPYSIWMSDGAYWLPYAGRIMLYQSHLGSIGMTGSTAAGTSDLGHGLSGGRTRFKLGPPVDLPAGATGPNGSLVVRAKFSATNNANSKEVGFAFGKKYLTPTILGFASESGWATMDMTVEIQSRGGLNSQIVTTTSINSSGAVSNSIATTALNLTIPQQLFAFGVLSSGVATDEILLNSFSVELVRGA